MGFDPVTLSLMAMAMSAAGSMVAASSARSNAAYQAGIANNNASIAEANAALADRDVERASEDASAAGLASQRNAQQQDFRAREVIDGVRAEQQVSGLTGRSQRRTISTLSDLAGIDREAEITEGNSASEAYRGRARGFELEAADLRSRARVHRTDAKMAISNGRSQSMGHMLQAGATLAGGISDNYGGIKKSLASSGGSRSAGNAQRGFNNLLARGRAASR